MAMFNPSYRIQNAVCQLNWGRDKMTAVFQTTFSNALSWMELYEFRLMFHLSLFLRSELTILQHWFRWRLAADQATDHYLKQWLLVYWRIYAPLALNELSTLIQLKIISTQGQQAATLHYNTLAIYNITRYQHLWNNLGYTDHTKHTEQHTVSCYTYIISIIILNYLTKAPCFLTP